MRDVIEGADAPSDCVRVIDRYHALKSSRGAKADGRLYEIPMDAAQILDDPSRAIELMEEAVDLAADWDADVIGLGSMIGTVGGHGQHLADRGPVAVTTGNRLTVFSAYQSLIRASKVLGIELSKETSAVVGIPGSIATALGRLIAPPDYLETVQTLCRQTGTLLVIDEIQTGLGRTGEMIAEVRGQRLLFGIDFHPTHENMIRHFSDFDRTGLSKYIAPTALDAVRHLSPLFVMQTLLDDFGIYTQVARSKPSVLRVQPPLGVTEAEIAHFLQAVERCCHELGVIIRPANTMDSKSAMGNLEKRQTFSR